MILPCVGPVLFISFCTSTTSLAMMTASPLLTSVTCPAYNRIAIIFLAVVLASISEMMRYLPDCWRRTKLYGNRLSVSTNAFISKSVSNFVNHPGSLIIHQHVIHGYLPSSFIVIWQYVPNNTIYHIFSLL
jgi:hypothetical protein